MLLVSEQIREFRLPDKASAIDKSYAPPIRLAQR
jgi:hypothetical protein